MVIIYQIVNLLNMEDSQSMEKINRNNAVEVFVI